DLRRLGVDGPFDTVVCWFTSFGYFDDAYNRAVLAEFARVLKPGGRLAIEAVHHDGFVRRFTPSPFAVPVSRGDDALIDSSIFDPVTVRVRTERVVYRDGEVRRTPHEGRVPTLPPSRRLRKYARIPGWTTPIHGIHLQQCRRARATRLLVVPPTAGYARLSLRSRQL